MISSLKEECMLRRIVLTIFVLMLTSCNLPNQTTGTPPSALAPDSTSQALSTPTLIPIETLLALPTATFVPTSTPRAALASPINQLVNCRYGPSTAYAVVGNLEIGGQAEVVGKNIDVTWWRVKNPDDPSTFCWLAASVVDVIGNVDAMPVVATPPALVSNISIRIDPPSMNVSCNSFPHYVTANADITANGPAIVTWRWETSEGETIDRGALQYFESGSLSVFLNYTVNTGKDYWIQVHILAPNDVTGRGTFKVICVP